MSITSGNNGVALPSSLAKTEDDVYSIALKIARTMIGGADVVSHYSDFDKSPVEYGAILEDLKVALKDSTTYDPEETDIGINYDTILKRYFGTWNPKRFDTEINRSYAKMVLRGEMELSDFVAKLINNLDESEVAEADEGYHDFFSKFYTSGSAPTDTLVAVKGDSSKAAGSVFTVEDGFLKNPLSEGAQYEKFAGATKEQVFAEIRSIVKDMTYTNDIYSAGRKAGARLEDLRIVVPTRWLSENDVEFLAGVINMQKADLLAKIIETDGGHFTANDSSSKVQTADVIIICHVDAIGRVVRDRDMETAFVKERFSQWYGLKEDEQFFFNPYEKAYAILVESKN